VFITSGTLETSRRVLRGASFNNNNTDNLRAAARNDNNPNNRNNNNGFRVVLVHVISSLLWWSCLRGHDGPRPHTLSRSKMAAPLRTGG
jgi:hypothetical protein